VAVLTGFAQVVHQFYVVRFLLGLAEAGYFPGILLYLTYWFPQREHSLTIALDAGQEWHTDMSYSSIIAFANVLYGIRIPHRGGRPLGTTEFANMHAAYDDLPEDLKQRLNRATALHDFNKFWEMMRREKRSTRPALTEEQRRREPPVSHPVFLKPPGDRRNNCCGPPAALDGRCRAT
jgi:alpha-ketoglutarate-dependent taurine dioxygenase